VTVSRLPPSRVMTSMDRDLELTLVDRLRRGDVPAFDEIHRVFHTRLFNFLARLSRRREVAEDLVEETWLRLVEQAPKLRPDTRLGPWLFAVARNLYVSYCRSRALEASHGDTLISLWPGGTILPSPFEEAASTEFERALETALAALPPASREVLLLVAVEGLKPSEAAVICGLSPEAMRQRLSRARAQLARRLDRASTVGRSALREVLT
jgi:RNA polymerase sigma-70 factor (ECF subfamily)